MTDTNIVDRAGKGAALSATDYDSNVSSMSGVYEADATQAFTLAKEDQNKTIAFTHAGTKAITLPEMASAGFGGALHTDDFKVTLLNDGAGLATITPNAADSINTGDSTITLEEGHYVTLQTTGSSGTQWNIIGGNCTEALANFNSTGINDDATGERLEITDTSIDLGTAGADFAIRHAADDRLLTITGGNAAASGAAIQLYGDAHSVNPDNIVFRNTQGNQAVFSDSGNSWNFQANDVTTTGTFSSGDATVTDQLSVTSVAGQNPVIRFVDGDNTGISQIYQAAGSLVITADPTDDDASTKILFITDGGTALTIDENQNATFAGEINLANSTPIDFRNNANTANRVTLNRNASDTATLYGNDIQFFTNQETSSTKALTLDSSQNAQFVGYVKTESTTVAGLTAAATAGAGARSFVTDANATTFASVVAGGGSNGVPVYSDGTNWRIG